jgi:hypothetical protein
MASEQEHHLVPHPALPLSRDPGCPRLRSFLWAVLFLRRVVVTSWRGPVPLRGEQTLHDLVDASGVRRDSLPRPPFTGDRVPDG